MICDFCKKEYPPEDDDFILDGHCRGKPGKFCGKCILNAIEIREACDRISKYLEKLP